MVRPTGAYRLSMMVALACLGTGHTEELSPWTAASPSAPPRVVYSGWRKVCARGPHPDPTQTCFIVKDGRTEDASPAVTVELIERAGDIKKILRISLANPLQPQYGVRIIVDQHPPLSASFSACLLRACMAEYEATSELVAQLKQGELLTIQAIDLSDKRIEFALPLVGFARRYEGPPMEPKDFRQRTPDEIRREFLKTRGARGPQVAP